MRIYIAFTLGLLPFAASAQDLRVVTDIAPIHSLVSLVAGPDVQVDVLVSGAASPHNFQFTFDQAQLVQDADLVIWSGEALAPWLGEALETLAPDVTSLELLETGGWTALELRDDARFEDADHDGHDHHDHDEGAHDDDEHGAVDPHAWLDPRVATAWVGHIRDALIATDPDHTDLYEDRADTAQSRLMALDTELGGAFDDIPQVPYLVPHDAYQYYEVRAGRPAAGAISLSDASTPSPARVADLRALVVDAGVACILTDPQSRSEWVDLVAEGTGVRTAQADPLGSAFDLGEDHYFLTIAAINDAYRTCLSGN